MRGGFVQEPFFGFGLFFEVVIAFGGGFEIADAVLADECGYLCAGQYDGKTAMLPPAGIVELQSWKFSDYQV
ncbi:hypothetical protein M976_00552 [Buttiauxella ferragutiae ATCC 51602]|uniref:Uncharacterized protein n=1 Tax=Buttiauxella ferragutiae ATCC 51602 TaxID=1354252 RepID=A0ABX2WCV6_9ENTR|nr:hypothetical protein [Buttiauxella sp. S19-1]OAT32241.1 hypothetical protein M976_00552 [Buttiauxella ferragutiae ATCC 51602]